MSAEMPALLMMDLLLSILRYLIDQRGGSIVITYGGSTINCSSFSLFLSLLFNFVSLASLIN